MGLSTFYSLSLPAELDSVVIAQALEQLRTSAQQLVSDAKITITTLRWLAKEDCALAQATMNEDFSFARSACMPPGADRSSPLGTIPDLALYFRISSRPEHGIDIGVAKYATGAVFKMIGEDGKTETPYDGRWYFWTYIDADVEDETIKLKTLLENAKHLGFDSTYMREGEQ